MSRFCHRLAAHGDVYWAEFLASFVGYVVGLLNQGHVWCSKMHVDNIKDNLVIIQSCAFGIIIYLIK